MKYKKIDISIIKSRNFKILTLIIVLVLTFILRAHNFEKTPAIGNLEEMLYAWSGIYLVETGVPISWSTLDYPKRAKYFSGVIKSNGGKPDAGVNLYKPWLDEPPLFSLLVGSFAHLYGAKRTDMIPAAFIRTPVIIIAFFTSIVIFLIARFVSGFWTGVLAILVYGTTPIIVFGSRLAVPENLIAFLFSLTLLLILFYLKKPKFRYLVLIPLFAGLAGLSKPTGFFIAPIAIYFAITKKDFKGVIYIFLGTLLFILLYILYGLHYDSEIFWRITSLQSFRPVGFGSLAWYLVSPSYDWRTLIDSWYIFLTAAFVFYIFLPFQDHRKIVIFSLVYWVIVVMLSGGEGDLLAWYRYPTFPLLSIIGAWGLLYLIKNPNFFTSFITFGLLLGNRHLIVNVFNPNVTPTLYRAIFSSLMLPSLVQTFNPNSRLNLLIKTLMILAIIVGIYFNVKYIYNEFNLLCQGNECIFGPTTTLSRLYFPIIWRLITF